MSKPVFDDLFKFEGRRNRQSYLLIQLSSWAATAVGILLAIFGAATLDKGGFGVVIGSVLMLSGVVLSIGSILSAWVTSAQRCRDIGWPGWVCLVQLIPYVGFVAGLVIWIAPGDTAVENKYGPSCI